MTEDGNNNISYQEIDKDNPCGYCKACNSRILYPTSSISGDDYHINRCLECQVVFLSPRPTQDQVEKAYSDSYYGEGEAKFKGYIQKVMDHSYHRRACLLSKHITPPAKLLDIGCGSGNFLSQAIKRGFEGYGVELPGKASERASSIEGLKLKTGQLEDTDFPEDFFDAICLWHVFEHLAEPKKTLEIITKVIKPGGIFMIALPNIDSLQSKMFRGRWLHLDPPAHLFFITPGDLVSELNKLKMELVSKSYFSLTQNTFGMQQSILNCLMKKREVLFESLKGNKSYAKEYSSLNICLQTFLWLISLPVFVLLAIIEAAMGKGGTIQMVFKMKARSN